jgi:hypothetical protein
MNLNNFDTIIFDLDFTVWDGCEEKYWGKNLIDPIILKNKRVIGNDGKYIEFHSNIKRVLKQLYKNNKNLGFITLGGLLTVSYEEEPVVKSLKLYDVYKYFNHQKTILYKTDIKSKHIIQKGKTVFIDDSDHNIKDITENCPNITCIHRFSFNNWKELI